MCENQSKEYPDKDFTYIDAGKFKDKFYIAIVNKKQIIKSIKANTHIEAEYLAFFNAYLIFGNTTIYLSDNEFVVKHYNKEYNSKILLYNLLRDHIKEAEIKWIPRKDNLADKALRNYFKKLKGGK